MPTSIDSPCWLLTTLGFSGAKTSVWSNLILAASNLSKFMLSAALRMDSHDRPEGTRKGFNDGSSIG